MQDNIGGLGGSFTGGYAPSTTTTTGGIINPGTGFMPTRPGIEPCAHCGRCKECVRCECCSYCRQCGRYMGSADYLYPYYNYPYYTYWGGQTMTVGTAFTSTGSAGSTGSAHS